VIDEDGTRYTRDGVLTEEVLWKRKRAFQPHTSLPCASR
jgi:hypothetical protein